MLSEGDAPKNIKIFLSKLYDPLNKLSFGTLGIVRHTIQRFVEERGAEAAAGTAFFTIFSLFPLLLVLVYIGSFFLERQQVRNQLMDLVRLTFPISPELVLSNIEQVLKERSAIGIAGLIGLVWSASGVLSILTRNITRAWPGARLRTFLESRVMAFIMIAALVGLLMLSSISATVLDVLAQFSEPLFGRDIVNELPLSSYLTNLVPLVIGFFIFICLYRWVPNTHVPWKAAFWGALVASLAWRIATIAFSYYLRTGLGQYEIVYGTLGTIVALMFWIYMNYLIIIFGAHLSAAIEHYKGGK